jgi:hypothetical protein
MGRKSAHSGMSPKERSINLMDKFIARNASREKDKPALPARRKDNAVPLHLWPLKDQIEFWNNRTDTDRFNESYSSYSTWHDEVKQRSGIYPQTFLDFTSKLKTEMRTMWETKVTPRDAVLELRKRGVY